MGVCSSYTVWVARCTGADQQMLGLSLCQQQRADSSHGTSVAGPEEESTPRLLCGWQGGSLSIFLVAQRCREHFTKTNSLYHCLVGSLYVIFSTTQLNGRLWFQRKVPPSSDWTALLGAGSVSLLSCTRQEMANCICEARHLSRLLIFNLSRFLSCFGLFLSEYSLSGHCGGDSLGSSEKSLYFHHVYACK